MRDSEGLSQTSNRCLKGNVLSPRAATGACRGKSAGPACHGGTEGASSRRKHQMKPRKVVIMAQGQTDESRDETLLVETPQSMAMISILG